MGTDSSEDRPAPSRSRVFIYITYRRQLLVFDHVDFPELGIQIPGGTIEEGEPPKDAAMREAFEETGLTDLRLKASLGDLKLDLSPCGKNEIIHAYFYHIEVGPPPPTRWRHLEKSPHGENEPIEFELYWLPLIPRPPLGDLDSLKWKQLIASLDCP